MGALNLDDLAESLHAREAGDVSEFQRRARVLQSMWREEHGIQCGRHQGRSGTRLLGSRLPMPWAQESLENFLTEPGRGDARYLNDRSAFDVFLGCRTAAGGRAFIGIEVKYHENLVGTDGRHQARYDEVADRMGCFLDGREPLKSSPLQQIWRDHLLAGITRIVDGYADAVFAVLYPRDNPHVSAALNDYRKQLSNSNSFAAWTLEHMVSQLRDLSDASWIDLFSDRYLAFDKIDSRLSGTD